MAGGFQNLGKDSLDITELASLNDDISDDLINKLEHEISEKMGIKVEDAAEVNENDDSTLFEEPKASEETTEPKAEASKQETAPVESKEDEKTASASESASNESEESNKSKKTDAIQTLDDNFIKKYKAKLKNKAQGGEDVKAPSYGGVAPDEEENTQSPTKKVSSDDSGGDITELSQGNISERPLSADQKKYNDSLDYLDRNVKYSKYVIYIDPQNVNFIESLTVKERKNLINSILRQQDDIALTKLRFKVIKTIILHVLIVVLTISLSIPIVYHVINASLEATINNHRNAQTNWQTLYKEHGKITQH